VIIQFVMTAFVVALSRGLTGATASVGW
jgi:hypothetical protein